MPDTTPPTQLPTLEPKTVTQSESEPNIVHPLEPKTSNKITTKLKPTIIVLILLLAGIGSGYFLTHKTPSASFGEQSSKTNLTNTNQKNNKVKEAGLKDSKVFPDEAEGLIEINDGSVTGEGTHQLIREGGPSQTVYLTSSVVDLTKFENKKVQIKGQTFTGQTAGWFMDVGWIKVIE